MDATGQPCIHFMLLTFNSASTVSTVIAAIRRQDYPHVCLTVRDNASIDATQSILRDLGQDFSVARANEGYVRGMNWLLSRRSREDVVVLLNADCVVSDNFATQVATIRKFNKQAAVVGAQVYRVSDENVINDDIGAFSVVDGGRLGVSADMRVIHPRGTYEGGLNTTFKMNGACPVLMPEALEKLELTYGFPGFDEVFDTYGEDIDFAFRVWRAGVLSLHSTELVAYHARSHSSGAVKTSSKRGRLRVNVIAARHINNRRHGRYTQLPLIEAILYAEDFALFLMQYCRRDPAIISDILTAWRIVSRARLNCVYFRKRHGHPHGLTKEIRHLGSASR